MNIVNLFGRIARDIEVRYSGEGKAIARTAIAVRRDENSTDFINVVAFGKTAEILEKYFAKGAQILINGNIKTGSYEKDGRNVYTTDVIAERVYFVDKKSESDSAPGFEPIGEELPFN